MTDDQIIEAFLDAVCDGGSPVGDCGCGRVYFNFNGEFMEEGELEGYW